MTVTARVTVTGLWTLLVIVTGTLFVTVIVADGPEAYDPIASPAERAIIVLRIAPRSREFDRANSAPFLLLASPDQTPEMTERPESEFFHSFLIRKRATILFQGQTRYDLRSHHPRHAASRCIAARQRNHVGSFSFPEQLHAFNIRDIFEPILY